MSPASEKRLSKLHPTLVAKIRAVAEALLKQGITVEVGQGLRTFIEQDALFAQGRTKPGIIVTRARGGQSNHNFGTAADLVPMVNGKVDWKNLKPFMAIGAAAKAVGLEWGGDWKKFLDMPHVQLPGPSVQRCLVLFKAGGLERVWKEFK